MKGDIGDRTFVDRLFAEHKPRAVVHFAAESHVDRSIHGPAAFVQTNVVGTFELLEATLAWWRTLEGGAKTAFRFLHVSTDEVYGSLAESDPAFSEATPYAPNSPYSASKAGSDHLVRAYHHTYGLPTVTTNCSNNYGPFSTREGHPPDLQPLEGKSLPVYATASSARLFYVVDHAAIRRGWRPCAPRGLHTCHASAAHRLGARHLDSCWPCRPAPAATAASSRRSPIARARPATRSSAQDPPRAAGSRGSSNRASCARALDSTSLVCVSY